MYEKYVNVTYEKKSLKLEHVFVNMFPTMLSPKDNPVLAPKIVVTLSG